VNFAQLDEMRFSQYNTESSKRNKGVLCYNHEKRHRPSGQADRWCWTCRYSATTTLLFISGAPLPALLLLGLMLDLARTLNAEQKQRLVVVRSLRVYPRQVGPGARRQWDRELQL
jgi:hypothetical protein